MISSREINDILKGGANKGHEISMKDIAYVILNNVFEEWTVPYNILFGNDTNKPDPKEYNKCKKLSYINHKLPTVRGYVAAFAMPPANYIASSSSPATTTLNSIFNKKSPTDKDIKKVNKDISFEENKDALINLLDQIKKLAKEGEIEAKDAVKLETDIRIKLNDKFDVSTNKSEKRVVVNAKYNHICSITRKECWLQTKEFAMEHWGLVEKSNNSVGNNN